MKQVDRKSIYIRYYRNGRQAAEEKTTSLWCNEGIKKNGIGKKICALNIKFSVVDNANILLCFFLFNVGCNEMM